MANQNEAAEVVQTPIKGYFAMDGPGVKRVATKASRKPAAS
jgi:hypothetical protein